MIQFARHTMFVLLLFASVNLPAQDITGTWEGIMGDEFIQVNVEQRNNELCGYTYDYILRSPRDQCRAHFVGRYSEAKNMWLLDGISFINNSGSHVLMRIRLWREEGDPANILQGITYIKTGLPSILGFSSGQRMELRRVTRTPNKLKGIPVCFEDPLVDEKKEEKKDSPAPVPARPLKVKPVTPEPVKPEPKKLPPPVSAKPVTPKPVTPKPVTKPPVSSKPPVAKPVPAPKKPADSLVKKPIAPKPITVTPVRVPKKETIPAIKRMEQRKQTELSHLEVNVRTVNLKLYDNGVVDNDTVSVYYNGRLIAGKQWLSEKPLVLDIELDNDRRLHEITLFAENLGSIPPNTALLVITAGDKRYELHSKASLVENAVLVLEYKPPGNGN